MTENRAVDPYELADASLCEKEARLLAELEAVRKSRAAIIAAREASGWTLPVSALSPTLAAQTPHGEPHQVSDEFRGLGLERAAAKVISKSDHLELTAKQVWAVLEAGGYSLLSDKPEQSVSWALRKREKKVGDVILIGDGKWGMVDWYSQARLKELRAGRNNASTRNHAEHIEKTKAGIANAKQTCLSHWGRRRSITAEQMAGAYYALKNGAKSKLAAAKAGRMTWPTFAMYWQQFTMEDWKPGDTFPPPRRTVEKKNSEIKLEEMWPPEKQQADGHINGHANESDPQLALRAANSSDVV